MSVKGAEHLCSHKKKIFDSHGRERAQAEAARQQETSTIDRVVRNFFDPRPKILIFPTSIHGQSS